MSRKKKNRKADTAAGKEQIKEMEELICRHADELALSLNLRLLPASIDGEMLWVESVMVTTITYPKKRPKRTKRSLWSLLSAVIRPITNKF